MLPQRALNLAFLPHRAHQSPLLARAAAERQAGPGVSASGDEFIQPDDGFSLSKTSFGSILTPLGGGLLVYGFGSYFGLLPANDLAALLLIYGFPITLLGFALSYAQASRATAAAAIPPLLPQQLLHPGRLLTDPTSLLRSHLSFALPLHPLAARMRS